MASSAHQAKGHASKAASSTAPSNSLRKRRAAPGSRWRSAASFGATSTVKVDRATARGQPARLVTK
jgi:hypothetical protein